MRSDIKANLDSEPESDTGDESDFDVDSSDTDLEDIDKEAARQAGHFDPSMATGVWRTFGKHFQGLVTNYKSADNLIQYPFKSGDDELSLQAHIITFKRPKRSIGAWHNVLRGIVSNPDNPPPMGTLTLQSTM